MKLYNYNTDEMTIEEITEAINTIENDPYYFSALMADRLIGTEKEEYEHNCNVLYNLRIARRVLREQTVSYWQEVKESAKQGIDKWTEELAAKPTAFKRYELNRSIEDANKTIAKANKKIEELRG
jgi:gas vesicle protein